MVGRDPAPMPVRLVEEFVNTVDIETGTDELGDLASTNAWVAAALGEDRPARLTERDRRALIDVREALRNLLLANAGEALAPAALATLQRAAADATLTVQVDERGVAQLRPAGRGVSRVVAVVLAAMTEAMRDGTWPRLKACREDDCRWAFYDHSRNRSRTWCSMAVCGNRAKARAFRERQSGRR